MEEVRTLAAREGTSESTTTRRWLYLVLAWLFEHRAGLDDPLQAVETVYAEFDYPEEIAKLVRYMATDDPDLGDAKLNENRLLEKWEQHLAEEQARLTG